MPLERAVPLMIGTAAEEVGGMDLVSKAIVLTVVAGVLDSDVLGVSDVEGGDKARRVGASRVASGSEGALTPVEG